MPPKPKEEMIPEKESEANDVHASEDESVSETIQAAEEELEVHCDLIEDNDSDAKIHPTEETAPFLGVDDVNVSTVYSSILPLPVSKCTPPTRPHQTSLMTYGKGK